MSFVDSHRISRGHAAMAAFAFVLVALFTIATRAQAAETIYWDNYDASPPSVSFAGIDGGGGGSLNLSGAELDDPEGMAYDSVTNRLFVASSSSEQIVFVNLDGSGAGVLATPGVSVEEPEGIAVDPATRIVYWTNADGPTAPAEGSIAWARIDGSGGGLLSTTGATLESPFRLALDPVAGRVYWDNAKLGPDVISWANVNNSGGGDLNLSGATPPESVNGFALDPAGGRLYWLNNSKKKISFASLGGGGGGDVNYGTALYDGPYGLAFDPSLARLYWGNYGAGESRTEAIGSVLLGGGVNSISPVTAPVNGPQDPVILKSPTGTGAPTVSRSATTRSSLTCSSGSWGADFPGSFVYQAPRTFTYQWTLNGAPIGGATAATLETTKPGSYGCVVTAANQTGNAAQTS